MPKKRTRKRQRKKVHFPFLTKPAPAPGPQKQMTWEDALRIFYPSYSIPTHAASTSFQILHDIVHLFFAPLEVGRKRASRGTVRLVPLGREREFVQFVKDALKRSDEDSSDDDIDDKDEGQESDHGEESAQVIMAIEESDHGEESGQGIMSIEESKEVIMALEEAIMEGINDDDDEEENEMKLSVAIESDDEESVSDDKEQEEFKKCSICSAAKTSRWCDGQTIGYELVCLGYVIELVC